VKKKPQRTAQRIAIYDFIKDNKSHPSAKEIFQHVSKKLSNVSLTTIYNTMELFKESGYVSELPLMVGGEGRRFDSNTHPHDHLICTACGRVVDIHVSCDHHPQLLSEAQKHDFDVQQISVTVFGVCQECKKKEVIN